MPGPQTRLGCFHESHGAGKISCGVRCTGSNFAIGEIGARIVDDDIRFDAVIGSWADRGAHVSIAYRQHLRIVGRRIDLAFAACVQELNAIDHLVCLPIDYTSRLPETRMRISSRGVKLFFLDRIRMR